MESLASIESIGLPKEFDFVWDKHLSYLTLNKVKTKVTIENSTLSIDRKNHILGIIPGSTKNYKLPLSNISNLVLKKSINVFDMILGLMFTAVGFANPFFFIIALIWFWVGFSTKLVITTNLKSKFMIYSNTKEDMQRLIEVINEIPIIKE